MTRFGKGAKPLVEKLIDIAAEPAAGLLNLLISDKTTKKKIIWATDTYEEFGEEFTDKTRMNANSLLAHAEVIRPRIEKSQEAQAERTRKKAEVFTPAWLCNRMNNALDEDWFGRGNVFNTENEDRTWTPTEGKIEFPKRKKWQRYVDSRRLEITCGEAPYLVSRYDVSTGELIFPLRRRVGILDRKLRIVDENTETRDEWLKWTFRAFEAAYGYEYQGDSVLIARINLLLTFVDYYEERWGRQPDKKLLRRLANKIVWNVWQMDGLKDTVPLGKLREEFQQITLFDLLGVPDELERSPDAVPCRIYNWRGRTSLRFADLKEMQTMGKKLFDYVIGNPPYQKESSESVSKTNGQKPMTNIFQYFQEVADELAEKASVLVYPGGRWIHQSGKGLQDFGKKQINDKSLSVVEFYPDAGELFGDAASLSDGITIVTKNYKKTSDGFTYVYSKKGEKFSVHADNPDDKLMPLDPHDLPIEQKINAGMKKRGLNFLHDAILPRSLFPIESDFVEKNPTKVRKYNGSDEDVNFATEIKLFTNDRAGKAGRATWFIANKDVITRNENYIAQWQVVVSSANAGGQKRDYQLEIIDNHSAFGRSRLALKSFASYEEAKNFFDYVSSYFIRYTFLLTDEALTSLGKEVPDLQDYTSANPHIDFTKNIDAQLCQLFNISDDEFAYMKNRVTSLRGGA